MLTQEPCSESQVWLGWIIVKVNDLGDQVGGALYWGSLSVEIIFTLLCGRWRRVELSILDIDFSSGLRDTVIYLVILGTKRSLLVCIAVAEVFCVAADEARPLSRHGGV